MKYSLLFRAKSYLISYCSGTFREVKPISETMDTNVGLSGPRFLDRPFPLNPKKIRKNFQTADAYPMLIV